MKKIFFLGMMFALFAVTASAQKGNDVIQRNRTQQGFESHQLTRGEKFKMHKNRSHFRHQKRRAFHDGKVTPMEKRRLHQMRKHNHRENFRMKHNFRKRVI